jgi:hypothetical protein
MAAVPEEAKAVLDYLGRLASLPQRWRLCELAHALGSNGEDQKQNKKRIRREA